MAMNSLKALITKHPILKGMLAYGLTWPVGCIVQQSMDGKRWGKYFIHFFHKKIILNYIFITFTNIHRDV